MRIVFAKQTSQMQIFLSLEGFLCIKLSNVSCPVLSSLQILTGVHKNCLFSNPYILLIKRHVIQRHENAVVETSSIYQYLLKNEFLVWNNHDIYETFKLEINFQDTLCSSEPEICHLNPT